LIVDVHAHLWREGDIRPILRAVELYSINRVFLSPLLGGYYPSPDHIRSGNDMVSRAVRDHPDIFLGFSYVNPTHGGGACEEFIRCVEELGTVGLKLWVAAKCSDPIVYPLIELAAGYGIPVLVHTWVKATGNLPFESTPMDLSNLASRYPEVKFIMAHLGGDWIYGIKSVRRNGNVYADISGTVCECGMVEAAVRELGEGRVLFGSDMPGDFLPNLGKVLGADISEEAREHIFWRNAAELFGLELTGP